MYDNIFVVNATSNSEYGVDSFDGISSDPSTKRIRTVLSEVIVNDTFIRASAVSGTVESSLKLSADSASSYAGLFSNRVGLISKDYTILTGKVPGAYLAGRYVGIEGDDIRISTENSEVEFPNIDIIANSRGFLTLGAGQLLIQETTNTFGTLPLTGTSKLHQTQDVSSFGILQSSAFCDIYTEENDSYNGIVPDYNYLGFGNLNGSTSATSGYMNLLNFSTNVHTDGYLYNMQMAWGELSPNTDSLSTGNIAIRKGRNNADFTDGKYTKWEYLAKISDLTTLETKIGTKTAFIPGSGNNAIAAPKIYAVSGNVRELIPATKYTITEGVLTRSGDIAVFHMQVKFSQHFMLINGANCNISQFAIFFDVASSDAAIFIPYFNTTIPYINRDTYSPSGNATILSTVGASYAEGFGEPIQQTSMVVQLFPGAETNGVVNTVKEYDIEINITYKNRMVTT